jgi:glycosyltransferase involved in cell wall biosynthesis
MTLWLDVTTILQWQFRPVGIIRVEQELAREWLQRSSRRFRFCRYEPEQRTFLEVTAAELRQLAPFASLPPPRIERIVAALSRGLAAGPCRWPRRLLAGLGRRLPLPGPGLAAGGRRQAAPQPPLQLEVRWQRRDTYLSLGLDWDDKDHGVLLARKRQHGFRVVLCCYDLIPVLFPHFTLATTCARFPAYLQAMAACADAVLCISECTRRDLQQYLTAQRGPQPHLQVFQLGADLPVAAPEQAGVSSQVAALVAQGPFILMVSTIEARKGHAVLYEAYRRLLSCQKNGVPRLLLVGMQGWGVQELVDRIRTDPLVAGSIHFLANLPDADLASLYRACLFTVFPSQYEGWGLPVAESLAYGKFCLASDRASIPEVGGALCEYLDADDGHQWAERIGYYSQHPAALAAKEKRIRAHFKPHSWRQTANQVLAVVQDRANRH